MVLNWHPGRTALVTLLLILMAASAAHAQAPRIDQATLEEPNQKTREVSTDELKRTLAHKTAVVLDARPYREFAMSHVPGAQNVAPKPGVAISMYVSDVKEVERLVDGDKSKPLILYCNGPFCGKSKRLSEELLAAGFTNVRRYQLGIPVWRALGGLTEIELEGVQHAFQSDRTAVFLDARSAEEFSAGTLPGARNIPQSAVEPGKGVGEVRKAKDDGRLPMEDHNTRIIVFGRDAVQARGLAEAIAREAFHNVAYFPGPFDVHIRTMAVWNSISTALSAGGSAYTGYERYNQSRGNSPSARPSSSSGGFGSSGEYSFGDWASTDLGSGSENQGWYE